MKLLSELRKIGTILFCYITVPFWDTDEVFIYVKIHKCFYVYTFSGVNFPIGSCSKLQEFWDTWYIHVKPQSKS